MPRPLVLAAAVMLAVFVVAALVALVRFALEPALPAERINPELSDTVRALRVAAALFGGISLSSFVLAVHFQRINDYTSTEEIIFFLCFGISLGMALFTGIPGVAAAFV